MKSQSRDGKFTRLHCVCRLTGSEPTEKDMRIIFPSEARKLWGDSASIVSGATFLINDPPQFLDHYYQ